jgi:hypothetical protein
VACAVGGSDGLCDPRPAGWYVSTRVELAAEFRERNQRLSDDAQATDTGSGEGGGVSTEE